MTWVEPGNHHPLTEDIKAVMCDSFKKQGCVNSVWVVEQEKERELLWKSCWEVERLSGGSKCTVQVGLWINSAAPQYTWRTSVWVTVITIVLYYTTIFMFYKCCLQASDQRKTAFSLCPLNSVILFLQWRITWIVQLIASALWTLKWTCRGAEIRIDTAALWTVVVRTATLPACSLVTELNGGFRPLQSIARSLNWEVYQKKKARGGCGTLWLCSLQLSATDLPPLNTYWVY